MLHCSGHEQCRELRRRDRTDLHHRKLRGQIHPGEGPAKAETRIADQNVDSDGAMLRPDEISSGGSLIRQLRSDGRHRHAEPMVKPGRKLVQVNPVSSVDHQILAGAGE